MMEHGNGTTKIAIDPAHLGMEKLSDRCVSFLNDIDILLLKAANLKRNFDFLAIFKI